MGMLVDGKWKVSDQPGTKDGRFVRPDAAFSGRVGAGTAHSIEAGRYRLYVSLACPWAHRTIIVRMLKGLEDAVGLTVLAPVIGDHGWEFTGGPDLVSGARYLYELYQRTDPAYTGRVTVPVLWDTATGRILNNDSAQIMRMLNAEFDTLARHPQRDYYPESLRGEIDTVNERVYRDVNNGVYRAGFAQTQDAYEEAVMALFGTLDWLDARLRTQRYLVDRRITEADWRLFTTLMRFDAVYHYHFKCNLRRLMDYPALHGYARELYQHPGVAATVDLGHIKASYYRSMRALNPFSIVPVGPEVDFTAPHGRDGL